MMSSRSSTKTTKIRSAVETKVVLWMPQSNNPDLELADFEITQSACQLQCKRLGRGVRHSTWSECESVFARFFNMALRLHFDQVLHMAQSTNLAEIDANRGPNYELQSPEIQRILGRLLGG
jgi:hypothetical protein